MTSKIIFVKIISNEKSLPNLNVSPFQLESEDKLLPPFLKRLVTFQFNYLVNMINFLLITNIVYQK